MELVRVLLKLPRFFQILIYCVSLIFKLQILKKWPELQTQANDEKFLFY